MLLLLLACDNAPDQLAESWQIDRLRVLAVAAEPAEARPGDVVTFSSLIVSPVTPVSLTTWFACLPESSDAYGCTLDPSVMDGLTATDPTTLTPEEQAKLFAELQAAGLIGIEPYFSPVWTVPDDALDGLEEAAKVEGLSAIVSVTAIPEGDDVDESDLELAYKRLPISLATTPNHNPVTTGFAVDDVAIAAGARVTVAAGQAYLLAVGLDAASVETYDYVDDQGVSEVRTEEPYFTWYAEAGSFSQTNTLYPTQSVTWTAPATPGVDATVWVVVRDRRGGMAWDEVALHVE